jgi:hypothetical protein
VLHSLRHRKAPGPCPIHFFVHIWAFCGAPAFVLVCLPVSHHLIFLLLQDMSPLRSGNSDDNKIDIIQVVSTSNAVSIKNHEHSQECEIGRRKADRWTAQ